VGLVKGRRPSGAVLHSSREPGIRRPCSDFMDMLRRLINCRIIIIIIIVPCGPIRLRARNSPTATGVTPITVEEEERRRNFILPQQLKIQYNYKNNIWQDAREGSCPSRLAT